jgi:hypothetical protein
VESELADRFAGFGEAEMELFDYIEVFCNFCSAAAGERRR